MHSRTLPLQPSHLLLPVLAMFSFSQMIEGQTRFMYLNGQSISPAYEGWWPNEDGSFSLFLGYICLLYTS